MTSNTMFVNQKYWLMQSRFIQKKWNRALPAYNFSSRRA